MTAIVLLRMPPSLKINKSTTTSSSTTNDDTNTLTSLDNSSSSLDQASCSATSAAPAVRRNSRRRRVCFSSLDVYTFDQILGDNPSVSCGAPLALAPEHSSHIKHNDIGYFEYKRKPKRATRKDLMESKQAREDYLKENGYTVEEIEAATTEAALIKKKRERHLPKQWDKFHVAVEKTQKLLRLGQYSRSVTDGESASALLLRHEQCTRAA